MIETEIKKQNVIQPLEVRVCTFPNMEGSEAVSLRSLDKSM